MNRGDLHLAAAAAAMPDVSLAQAAGLERAVPRTGERWSAVGLGAWLAFRIYIGDADARTGVVSAWRTDSARVAGAGTANTIGWNRASAASEEAAAGSVVAAADAFTTTGAGMPCA